MREFEKTTVLDPMDADRMTRPSLSYWSDAWRRFRSNKVAMVSSIILLIIILMAIVQPMVSRYDYDTNDLFAINQGPSMEHLFGTDELGRDIFVRCWEGARVSLKIALVVAILNGTIGILYGGIAGYFGGIADNLMMRFCELIASIPQMLWVVLLILIMQPGVLPIIVAISRAFGLLPISPLSATSIRGSATGYSLRRSPRRAVIC